MNLNEEWIGILFVMLLLIAGVCYGFWWIIQ